MVFKFAFASLGLVVFTSLMRAVEGGNTAFLGPRSSVEADKNFLLELAGAFTHANASGRIEEWKDRVATIVKVLSGTARQKALPKDRYGRVQHDVVQYALHRAFLHYKSWNIRGLNPNSEKTKEDSISLSAMEVNPDFASVPFVPTMLQNTIEQQHIGMGLDVDEIAALAASIQDLAHQQSLNRLVAAYKAHSVPLNSTLTIEVLGKILPTYVMMFMFGSDFSNLDKETLVDDAAMFSRSFRYAEVFTWMEKTLPQIPNRDETLASFSDLDRYFEAFDNNFNLFSERECKSLKSVLVGMEGRKPGRVRVSDFYNRSIIEDGSWWLGEKVDYLRMIGAIDDTNASNLQVIMANYITSPTQCFKAMDAYDVCCHNECEDLMDKIEKFAGAPEAQPDALADFVATLETDTVKPQGRLPEAVTKQLLEISHGSGGLVALYSRNFALWMHQVFPRECPFPHKQGSTSPLTPDEWMQSTGQSTQLASREEMEEFIRPDDTCPVDGCEHQLLDLDFESTFPDQVPDAPHNSETLYSHLTLQNMFIALAAFTLASVSFTSKVKPRKKDQHVF